MSEYSERCCYCGDFYLAYGVVRAVMNGTLHTRIRCRYYLASAANSKAPRHGRYPASGGQLWCPACEAPVEECREADEIRATGRTGRTSR